VPKAAKVQWWYAQQIVGTFSIPLIGVYQGGPKVQQIGILRTKSDGMFSPFMQRASALGLFNLHHLTRGNNG
jgi:hypothetical protein